MTNREIRHAARTDLSGRWTEATLPGILFFVIGAAIMIPVGIYTDRLQEPYKFLPLLIINALYVVFFMIPMMTGMINAFNLFTTRDTDEEYGVTDEAVAKNMFSLGYGHFGHTVGGILLAALNVFLFSLLLIVPGLIRLMEYMAVPFILVEEPELGLNETLKKSRRMMQGYRMQFFLMLLCFVILALLSIVTLFIAIIWLVPFFFVSYAKFYQMVKKANS